MDVSSKPLVIYHSPCMDGFTAAWAIWLLHPDWEFVPGVHGAPPPDVKDRLVFMVDFSYKRPVLLQMMKKARHITIIDHHKTAEKELVGLDKLHAHEQSLCPVRLIFDMERSGAALTWSYFHTEDMPWFVQIVEDRDLWKFSLPDTRELCSAIFSHDYSFETWSELCRTFENKLSRDRLYMEGVAIERKQNKDILELTTKVKERMVIAGQEVWAANLPYTFSSDAGHLLCQGEPFAATYYREPNGWTFSLRSSEDGADVSEIAKKYGGGGHAHAAGFRVTELSQLS